MKYFHVQEDKTHHLQYDNKGRASVGFTPPLLRAASSMGWLASVAQVLPRPCPLSCCNYHTSYLRTALCFRSDLCTTPKEAWSVPRQLAYKFPLPRGLLFFFFPSPDLIYTTISTPTPTCPLCSLASRHPPSPVRQAQATIMDKTAHRLTSERSLLQLV